MRTVAIIQARLGSSRLPAKVMLHLAGKPALLHCIERTRSIASVDEVVVATTEAPADDVIARACDAWRVPVFRGPEDDVLARYLGAAAVHAADVVVRITSDCPLLDPFLADRVVRGVTEQGAEYASSSIVERFPRGLDAEAVTLEALRRSAESATIAEREHVTLHVARHPERFSHASITSERDESRHRWTLDTLDDYALLAALFDRGAGSMHRHEDVLAFFDAEPALFELNAHVRQKAV